LSDFNETGIFPTGFSKNTEISNFMKIRPVGSRAVPSGRPGGHDEPDSRFSKLCESA